MEARFRRRTCGSSSPEPPTVTGSSPPVKLRPPLYPGRGACRGNTCRETSGRVLRHLANTGADLHGCDYNARLIAWSIRNLPFGTFTVNEQLPPLRFRADEFDLAYAISVFTHLAEPLQRPWLNELARITKPGGLILITTHGDSHYPGLTATEQARFKRGEIVVRNRGIWHEPLRRLPP